LSKKKLILLVENIFSKRDYYRFCIKDLKKHFDVKVIDFTFYLKKDYFKKYFKLYSYKNYYKYIFIVKKKKDFDQIQESINVSKEYLVLDFAFSQNYNNKNLFNLKKFFCEKKNINLVYLNLGCLPAQSYVFYYLKIKNFFLFFLRKFFLGNIIYYNYFISSGKLVYDFGLNYKKNLPMHSFDFNKYLIENKSNTFPEIKHKKYAVFLDDMMPDHPDINLFFFSKKSIINFDVYFKLLKNFFLYFKKKNDFKIVFAAHPRRKNLDKIKEFKIFDDYFLDKTLNIVKFSKLVFVHCSTSVSFANIFKKPIVYLNSKKIYYFHNKINAMHNKTGGLLANLDDVSTWDINLKKIDFNKYKSYKDNYVKHPFSKNKTYIKTLLDLSLKK